jgi:predicted hotdog family 3-hydroxylacyl-ACP dehydratase
MPYPPATLDRAAIGARIPHRGSMCLLDRVTEWDESRIRCIATGHRDPANPLWRGGRLSAVCGIEYAAQAMAVHGALCADRAGAQAPKSGLLASARGVEWTVPRLDDAGDELQVEAERRSGGGNTVLYGFTLAVDGRVLLTGRAAVILDAEPIGRRP